MSEWQPIGTAPKDRPVLLWSPDATKPGVMIGFYLEGNWHDFWPDNAPQIDAWPTHWQPLPPPPTGAAA